tara:strand:- start:164 stop:469 length:306 start_codon:yes stop_codon:yes gene_type:complete
MKVNVADAILALEPTAQFSVTSEDLDKIEWFSDGVTQPSKSAIQTKLDELQAVEDAKEYQRDREAEYPSLQDCIHALLDGGDTLTDLQALRQAVKDKYPKE